MRSKDDAFAAPAALDMLCADIAEEMHTAFKKTRDQADRLKQHFSENDYTIVAELKVAP